MRGSRNSDVYMNVAGHVKDIRQHRLDQALVLGYYNYAEMSMVGSDLFPYDDNIAFHSGYENGYKCRECSKHDWKYAWSG